MDFKLGLLHSTPPRNALRLQNYLDYEALPPVLPSCSYLGKVQNWPMYLNDKLGCCVVSGWGHLRQNWTAWASNAVTYPDKTIEKIYSDITGYKPGDESTDNGMTLEDMLDYSSKKNNLWNDVIIADAVIDTRDNTEMKQAIRIFGGALTGLQLPATAQNQVKPGGTWTLKRKNKNGRPGTWGGHCVPILKYDQDLLYFVTWGFEMSMTWQFYNHYVNSAYAIYDGGWIDNENMSVSGFDNQQMLDDAQLI